MYKILSFISIYLLSIVNFAILLFPLTFVFVPIMFTGIPIEKDAIISVILLMFLFVNIVVLISVFVDLIFGFTTKSFIKGTAPYLKIKNYDLLTQPFEELKLQFNRPDVELRVSSSEQINAFAVGNFKEQYIVITKGIVSCYLMANRGDIKKFLTNMKCIMGHEMSHLINKDYMPGLLLQLNGLASSFISKIIIGILNIFFKLLTCIPIIGRLFSSIVFYLYKIINFLVSFFHKYILMSVYTFLQLKISRTNEYRCDRQSSYACGGIEMAGTLKELGDSGYINLFSTHPRTQDRMVAVAKIIKDDYIITPDGKNKMVNTIVILFVLLFPLLIWRFVNIKLVIKNYNDIVLNVMTRFRMLKIRAFTLFGIAN